MTITLYECERTLIVEAKRRYKNADILHDSPAEKTLIKLGIFKFVYPYVGTGDQVKINVKINDTIITTIRETYAKKALNRAEKQTREMISTTLEEMAG